MSDPQGRNPLDDEETWDEGGQEALPGVDCGAVEIQWMVRSGRPGAESGRRQEAEDLLAILMELPEDERHNQSEQSRLQDPLLFELLVEEGHARLLDDPCGAGQRVSLAIRLVELLNETGALSREIRGEGVSRALCLAGTAGRLSGDDSQAEAAFERAAFRARTVSAAGRGFFCRALGLLRWDQGRSDEALALLEYSQRQFAQDQDLSEEAACQALVGLHHVEEGHLRRAMEFLRPSCRDVGICGRPWLAAQGWLGLAFCLANARQVEESRAARRMAWRYLEGVPEGSRVWLHWLEGRGAVLTGDIEDGAALLEAARSELIARHWLPEATLATIDVGLLRVAAERGNEIEALIEEITAAFMGTPGLNLALGMLRDIADTALLRFPENCNVWRHLIPALRVAFRRQGVRLRPVPFI
jgi:hypothetical protein